MSQRPLRSVIVTGVDGFVGRHVAALAKASGVDVHGVGRAERLDPDVESSVASYVSVDLTQAWPEFAEADGIIHLAGLAAVGPSFGQPQRYIEANSSMVTLMCESLLSSGYEGSLVTISSGAVYAPSSSPLSEDSPVAAASPYAVSKLLVENQMEYYGRRGLRTVVARPFNHIGPGQRAGFLVPDLYGRLSTLPAGEALSVGNLSTRRDYLDVRDVARAYLTLAAAPRWDHAVYNVASGASLAGTEILAALADAMGRGVPELVTDAASVRPTDASTVTGSADRLRAEFGWLPEHTVRESIADFVVAHEADA
ncbi:NAD(P)-dependent oxidoreductase [Demequina sp. NBRC 110052]|uniref:NAD-dependent epimerase/dehydratase family protein n=1 Tax=Demequina sp. NBRC 110052 TaxID=1570341 RepID=UPI000A074E64|nr:NAD-dependent epimerase/dehydratase family protein [Demequina sp. NBRC 110052]